MKRFITSKKGLVLLATLVVAAAAAVGAYAYFTSTGSGSGTASVGTAGPWQIATLPASGGPLTPGGPFEVVQYTVTNGGSGQQELNSVTISVANPDGTPWTSVPGCSAADFSIDGQPAGNSATDAYGTATSDLPSGASTGGTIQIQMVDSGSNQDACKNATVPLYLSAS